jgi:hypothetical protein
VVTGSGSSPVSVGKCLIRIKRRALASHIENNRLCACVAFS